MAEPKPKNGAEVTGRKPPPKRPGMSLKGSPEWREWVRSFSKHMNMPATILIDQALKQYAKANEFDTPFPGR